MLKNIVLIIIFSLAGISAKTQQTAPYKPAISRILFLLDGSGSMKEPFEGTTKFEIAKQILVKYTDSVERKNPNVEFAVRVFGHQFPRNQNNCNDTKLEVPFGKNNAAKIKQVLDRIQPQGQTPIALSIEKGSKDFPLDYGSLNSIVLITDGLESCKGDPCKISKTLTENRVTLKPFIVGLNVKQADINRFDCIGKFYDARNEQSFEQTIGLIIKQTLNTTSAQLNLLDINKQPTVTNVPFTLYDHYSGKIMYNFIHALDAKGNPDTMFLDPVGVYDIEVHTFPPVMKKDIELIPGKHNIIAMDIPAGNLLLSSLNSFKENDAQILIRKNNDYKILNIQDLNESEKYLAADYDFEVLTTPPIFKDSSILPAVENGFPIAEFGTLSLIVNGGYSAFILQQDDKVLKCIERKSLNLKTENFKLQPGSYILVYKLKKEQEIEFTKVQNFIIESSRVTVLTL